MLTHSYTLQDLLLRGGSNTKYLNDLVKGLKMLIAQSEDHPAWMGILPPAPDGILACALHLEQESRHTHCSIRASQEAPMCH